MPSWQKCTIKVPTGSHSSNTFCKTVNSFCSYCFAHKFLYSCSQSMKICSKNVTKPETISFTTNVYTLTLAGSLLLLRDPRIISWLERIKNGTEQVLSNNTLQMEKLKDSLITKWYLFREFKVFVTCKHQSM